MRRLSWTAAAAQIPPTTRSVVVCGTSSFTAPNLYGLTSDKQGSTVALQQVADGVVVRPAPPATSRHHPLQGAADGLRQSRLSPPSTLLTAHALARSCGATRPPRRPCPKRRRTGGAGRRAGGGRGAGGEAGRPRAWIPASPEAPADDGSRGSGRSSRRSRGGGTSRAAAAMRPGRPPASCGGRYASPATSGESGASSSWQLRQHLAGEEAQAALGAPGGHAALPARPRGAGPVLIEARR